MVSLWLALLTRLGSTRSQLIRRADHAPYAQIVISLPLSCCRPISRRSFAVKGQVNFGDWGEEG